MASGWLETFGIPECPEDTKTIYDRNADTYEHYVIEKLSYTAYKRAVQVLIELVAGPNAEILDLCAGTGVVGVELHHRGYKNVSAHDGSSKMLKQAGDKGVYKHLYEELLYTDRPPKNIPQSHFDAIICCASFLPGHLTASHIPMLATLLKPNGVMVILTRKSCYYPCESEIVTDAEKEYMEENQKVLADLVNSSNTSQSDVIVLAEETCDGYAYNKEGIIHVLARKEYLLE